MIKPSLTLTQTSVDAIAARMEANAAHEARIMAEADGRAMVALCEEYAAELEPRTGNRHKANTTHLANSFTYRVHQPRPGNFPITVELTIKPGVNAKKIAALEYGVKGEHTITAGTKNPDAKYLRWGNAPGDLTTPFKRSVTWRPTGKIATGYHFMERARDAIAARRRRSR